ncbi:MAG: methylenetetrahydrofolate reductase [Pseudomonadota bacterium]
MPSPIWSVELFPPRQQAARFWRCIGQLETLEPAFVSLTCGALGSSADGAFDAVHAVNTGTRLPTCAHVTLTGFPEAAGLDAVQALHGAGLRRVMLLRGDGDPALPPNAVVHFVDRVRQRLPIDIAVACYPAPHPRARSARADLECLRAKCAAGADRAVSQMVFDADDFLRFRDRAVQHGVSVPLHAGVLPVVDFEAVDRLARRCGVALPTVYHRAFEGTDGRRDVQWQLGLDFAAELCERLIREGVDGLHLYALNTPGIAPALMRRVHAPAPATALHAAA